MLKFKNVFTAGKRIRQIELMKTAEDLFSLSRDFGGEKYQ